MDQPSATTPPATTAAPASQESRPSEVAAPVDPPGFGSRGRLRRRARFLRKARELAYRDLGGLVFNLHRFGQRNDPLVIAKLNTLGHIDSELRALEAALAEREPVTILREAGITACPRCAAIHSGEDRFCPNCGLSLSRNSNLPIAGAAPTGAGTAAAAVATAASAPAPAAPAQAPTAPAPAPAAPTQAPANAQAPGAAQPATAVHPATPSPAMPPSPPQPPAPVQPTSPATGDASPPTQTFAPVSPAAGRPPKPRIPTQDERDEDQPTEIIRPPATGS